MEKNEKAQEILAEVKVLQKIFSMYLGNCKNKFEQYQAKLLDKVEQMDVEGFLRPNVEALKRNVDSAKEYADAFEAGKNIWKLLESILVDYRELSIKYTFEGEEDAWFLINQNGENVLNSIRMSDEYPVVMNVFIEDFFGKLKDNDIVFYIDNDEENKRLLELLKDLGIIKNDKEIAVYNYCIEYAKNNPQLASKCFQSVDIMIEGLKK